MLLSKEKDSVIILSTLTGKEKSNVTESIPRQEWNVFFVIKMKQKSPFTFRIFTYTHRQNKCDFSSCILPMSETLAEFICSNPTHHQIYPLMKNTTVLQFHWWLTTICTHMAEAPVFSVSRSRGCFCPYCCSHTAWEASSYFKKLY